MNRIYGVVLTLFISLTSFSQGNDTAYSNYWLDIDTTLFTQSLNRTALAKIEKLYALAKTDNQPVQIIKTLLYRMYLEKDIYEDNVKRDVDLLKKEIAATNNPAIKSLLTSLLAEKFQNYYQQQQYRIYNRTKTADYKEEDFETWTVSDFHQTITYWYQQSVIEKNALQNQSIGTYDAILNEYTKNGYRPALYDLLAHRALGYFKNDNTYLTQPAYAFVIDQPEAIGNIETFINFHFTSRDSASNKWKALLLYQDLIRFHAAKHDTAALMDVNLERIQYAKQYGVFNNEDSLYYLSLQTTAEQFKNSRYAAAAFYLLAQYHANRAANYSSYQKDTTARFEYVNALSIIQPFLPILDSTLGHNQLYNLYHTILAKSINLQVEEVNVPALRFKMLVSFKNVDTLYYRIIRSTKPLEDTLLHHTTYRQRDIKSLFEIASGFPYLTQNSVALPVIKDYQQHTTELKIDGLPVGEYYILASVSPIFSDSANLAWQHLYVSNISYVNIGRNYFVLNRTTGKPLPKANVKLWQQNTSYVYKQRESYTTDNNGFFKIKEESKQDNYRYIKLEINCNDDHLFLRNAQYFNSNSYSNSDDDTADDDAEYEGDHASIFYFTDRSIYRPGQKVFFKMLMLTKERKTGNTKIFKPSAEDSLYVFLHDANDDEIDSLLVKVNEYGSFAGSFNLPTNLLTGEFSLLLSDDFNGENGGRFSVEEYKRPTFEVTLEKPKGEYKLGDSLTVTGTAKAYAGNAADGATVKYTVTRRGRFLYSWLWSKGITPNSEETTLTFGEAKTDAAGKFTISFTAKPDEEISGKSLPVFDYEVKVDVTDNAGETRSSTTTVSVGYHSLNVQLNVKSPEDADSLKNIFITTTNIAGDKQPANVKVSIIPLQEPTGLLRKKYWSQPDTFIYTKAQYKQWFPNDEYSNESDKTTWQKLQPAFTITINTKDANKVVVPKGLLKAGWYIVQATAIDKQGNEIKDEKYVQLYSRKAGQFNGNEYLFTTIVNNAVQTGESAKFLVGSSAADAFVIQEIQHKPAKKQTEIQNEFSYHALKRNVKTISVLPGRMDEGGMGVNFIMVKDNRVYTWYQTVQVQKKDEKLNIEVLTYRYKLEPGSNEKWTVKIGGKGKEKAAAEVLTSMYDASLDQFKPHQWQKPSLHESDFSGSEWYGEIGFTMASAAAINYIETPFRYAWYDYPEIEMDVRYFNRASLGMRVDTVPVVDINGDVVGYEIQMVRTSRGVRRVEAGMITSLDSAPRSFAVAGGVGNFAFESKSARLSEVVITRKGIMQDRKEEIIANQPKEDPPVKVRTNFNETAFFFPQLHTDTAGNLSFTFTLPEALTQWKWQVLAHDKAARFGLLQRTIVSQKTLMVQMNAPRFLRQGDQVELSAKISNLSDGELKGKATLQLIDAVTGEPIDKAFLNIAPTQSFTAGSKQSTAVKFAVTVPSDVINPLTWRIVARAGSYSDGEENTIPVLSKRILVTESLPMLVRGDGKKTFQLSKLVNNTSTTLQHQSLTVEYTSEPVWYAMQSLPYLIEFPYECAEQTFNRLFANVLAARIVNSHPAIKAVMYKWLNQDTANGNKPAALLSNLQKNEELKAVLLQETPWVLQAKTEAQQQKNLAVLFDVVKMSKSLTTCLEKVKQAQSESGGFSWFKGGYDDAYITQYILTGIGRLRQMNAIPLAISNDLETIAIKALQYLDAKKLSDYEELMKYNSTKNFTASNLDIQYLYLRSLFPEKQYPLKDRRALDFYTTAAKQGWNTQSNYFKAMTGAALYNAGDKDFVSKNILPALLENAVIDKDSAIYWKDMQRGYYWYQAPVEQQVMVMELVNDIYTNNKTAALQATLNDMKTWLLKQKQTNHWGNTKSTADACFALVLTGDNPANNDRKVTISAGNHVVNMASTVEGTGYVKERIEGKDVTASMGNITINTVSNNPSHSTPSWGAVYWQYFEDMDKVTTAATPLSIDKKIFKAVNTATGTELQQIKDGDALKVGDKLTIRIVLRSDRDMEYIHLKDMRAAGSEPVNVLSSYKWQDGLGYYESTKDASTNFFISNLSKGTYVFEYPLFMTHTGDFSMGVATAQCMYAPEFSSHSEGIRVKCR